MKTDCSKFGELLGAYADGELDADRAAQVEAHLATCAGCRRQIEILRDLDGLARQAGPPELHYDYWDWHRARVWRKLTRDTHERQRFYRPSFIWPKLAILAGSMAVVFVVVVLGWQALGPALFTQGEHASVDKLLVTSAPPRPTVPTDSERREPVADQISGGNFGNAIWQRTVGDRQCLEQESGRGRKLGNNRPPWPRWPRGRLNRATRTASPPQAASRRASALVRLFAR